MTGSAISDCSKETEFSFDYSASDLRFAEGKLLELEFSYLGVEEEFINNRTVLVILLAISTVLGVLTYLSRNAGDLVLLLAPITMGLGWGFYRVITGVIVAKSNMRRIRKIQKLLRGILANASRAEA